MKRMRYLLFGLIVFGVCLVVKAAEVTVTLDEMVKVINNGVITEEYLETLKNEIDSETEKKRWKNVSISASTIDGGLSIKYSFEGNEEIRSGEIRPTIIEDGKTLKYVLYFNEDEADYYKYDIEVMNLIPLWEIEASDKFAEIKKYVKNDYITNLNNIIDRCYRQEMHVCRTSVSTYGDWEYISDVELNDEPANYVITILEEQKAQDDNDRLMARLAIIAVVLIIIIIVLKSSTEPKKQAIKY